VFLTTNRSQKLHDCLVWINEFSGCSLFCVTCERSLNRTCSHSGLCVRCAYANVRVRAGLKATEVDWTQMHEESVFECSTCTVGGRVFRHDGHCGETLAALV